MAGSSSSRSTGPVYRLADYLDQYGRRTRRDHIPRAAFWAAAASCADPGDLGTLGDAAYRRGLYRDAAHLHKQASVHGAPAGGCWACPAGNGPSEILFTWLSTPWPGP